MPQVLASQWSAQENSAVSSINIPRSFNNPRAWPSCDSFEALLSLNRTKAHQQHPPRTRGASQGLDPKVTLHLRNIVSRRVLPEQSQNIATKTGKLRRITSSPGPLRLGSPHQAWQAMLRGDLSTGLLSCTGHAFEILAFGERYAFS